jgi:hypothetical protein
MADFDFLDGFDELGGDFGFTSVASKPSDKDIVNRLESKLDKILRATNEGKELITTKNETELEIAKKQMDDEYDLRKDNIGKDMKAKFVKIEKLVLPLMIKLAKAPEAYIHWPNRAQVIEEQVRKIVAITRG